MTCEGSANITIEFFNENDESFLEIRPRSMDFDRTRGKFDYCKAEFSTEVANHIQPQFDVEDSVLLQPLPALIRIESEPIHKMLYVPDGVTFGDDSLHVELHDPRKYLTSGKIDKKWPTVSLRDAFNYVFENRNTDGPTFFDEIKFTIPEESYDELITLRGEEFENAAYGEVSDAVSGKTQRQVAKELEEENVYNVIDSQYALNFDKKSPWECIKEMCEKFSVDTWVGVDGNLWVGERTITGKEHLSTIDDKRVWKITDYNINKPRNQIILSTVRGGYGKADPEEGWVEQAGEYLNLNGGTKDFRIEGIAQRTDVQFGQEIVDERPEAKRNALEGIAFRNLLAKKREQWAGYLEIDPEFSGSSRSEVKDVRVGDQIWTIPPQEDSNSSSVCDTNIQEQIYDIVGVQHSLESDGGWTVRLQIAPVLDRTLKAQNVTTRIRYYDPLNQETIEQDQYSAMGGTN